jgi:hypothetical protein
MLRASATLTPRAIFLLVNLGKHQPDAGENAPYTAFWHTLQNFGKIAECSESAGSNLTPYFFQPMVIQI